MPLQPEDLISAEAARAYCKSTSCEHKMPRPRAAFIFCIATTTTALRPTRRRDLFAVTAATYWKWGFAATGALHAGRAATALDADVAFPKGDDRPMLTVTPLVHPIVLGGRGSTYDMEPGIIGSIVSRPYN